MNITIEEVKDTSADNKSYVQDKDGFIYELLHDWGDFVTVLTESGKKIDFDKDTVKILDYKDVADDTIKLLNTDY